MHNFVFHNPTKVLFGKDKLPLLGNEIKNHGSKVLLVYGKESLKKHGTHSKILTSLHEAGLDVIELHGVEPNPQITKVREGIELAKRNGVEVVLAAGGGSAIDTGKAIAAGVMVEHDVWKFFTGKKSIKSCLPVATVLTIPGSGSEMNNSMVVTDGEKKLKFGFGHRLLYPKVSILDPTLTFTVNKTYTAYGAIDAICHILEFYMTHEGHGTQLNRRIMESIIRTLMNACQQCIIWPSDYSARSNLLWASTLSLNGLVASGLGKVSFAMHLLEHSISGYHNTPHGAGLSALLLNWLRYFIKTRPARVEELAKNIFPEVINPGASISQTNMDFIQHMKLWMEEVDLPISLAEMGLENIDYQETAERTKSLAKIWRLREYSPDILKTILTGE